MRAVLLVSQVAAAATYAYAHHQPAAGHNARHRAYAGIARQDEVDVRGLGDPYPTGPGYDSPPLESVSYFDGEAGDPGAEPTVPLPETFAAGATPPYPNASPLPTFVFDPAKWTGPKYGEDPDPNSPQVQEWMKELGDDIPNLSPSLNSAACDQNPQIADADRGEKGRCWWTCGGCTRDTDITTCTDKMAWGLTFDDGPSPYTPKLLTYLDSKSLRATFYVTGSNVIARPEMLQTEYMTGHEIAGHTWNHPYLTTLTNQEIVAQLGWTREAIKQVIGVTTRTFRPPFGDIDDRVRAIASAMGLTPVMWTGITEGAGEILFDSSDYKVHGKQMTSLEANGNLTKALDLAPNLDHGVVVLQHDLYQETVDLAVGTTIPEALKRNFNLQPVMVCQKESVSESYRETSGEDGPYLPNGGSGGGGGGGGGGSTTKPASRTTGSATGTNSAGPSQTGGASTRRAVGSLVALVAAIAAIAIC